ncbi:MAG: YtxH domain-containing protein [Gemmatimonas sp.]
MRAKLALTSAGGGMYESSDAREESADRKAFGLGLLIGAAVGAGAALLLAPDSGEEMRRRIRREARKLYLRSGQSVGGMWNEADRSTRGLRKSASKKMRSGMKRGRSYADDAAELVELGRRRLGWR